MKDDRKGVEETIIIRDNWKRKLDDFFDILEKIFMILLFVLGILIMIFLIYECIIASVIMI